MVSVNDNNPDLGVSSGAKAVKAVIVDLHERFLGQSLDVDDPEIQATYQLLVDSWQARQSWMVERGTWANGPDEGCPWYAVPGQHRDGAGIRHDDPSGMKSSWQSVIAYLMTDFNYLHE